MENILKNNSPDQPVPSPETPRQLVPKNWVALMGKWENNGTVVHYVPGEPAGLARGQPLSIGISVCDLEAFYRGVIKAEVSFNPPFPHSQHGPPQYGAGIILGFHSMDRAFYYVQFGNEAAYQISRYEPGFGFTPMAEAGSNSDLKAEQWYRIQARLTGERIELKVDGVRVLDTLLPRSPVGRQVALIAAGPAPVRFRDITVESPDPQAFMVMQFGQQLDHVWDQVIESVVRQEGFVPVRGDVIFGPNPILRDIKQSVSEAAVVVGEITPLNANVFYEIGFADALGKPLILLAQEGTKLPFDLSGYRVVFYRDRIGGESDLAEKLRRNLRACL